MTYLVIFSNIVGISVDYFYFSPFLKALRDCFFLNHLNCHQLYLFSVTSNLK